MAWEDRNGNSYYYRKKWHNGTCVSEYVGSGEFAAALAKLEKIDRLQREWERQQWQAEIDEIEAVDSEIRRLGKLTRAIVQAVLVANGFHTHKGSWRYNRGFKRRDSDEKTR